MLAVIIVHTQVIAQCNLSKTAMCLWALPWLVVVLIGLYIERWLYSTEVDWSAICREAGCFRSVAACLTERLSWTGSTELHINCFKFSVHVAHADSVSVESGILIGSPMHH